jgi:hypothetical protein
MKAADSVFQLPDQKKIVRGLVQVITAAVDVIIIQTIIETILRKAGGKSDRSKPKLSKEERDARNLAKFTIREDIFLLVAKVISWKTGSLDSRSMQTEDKISVVEWEQYTKFLLEISKTESVETVKNKLNSIYSAIRKNQGFI